MYLLLGKKTILDIGSVAKSLKLQDNKVRRIIPICMLQTLSDISIDFLIRTCLYEISHSHRGTSASLYLPEMYTIS